jgi:LCP family protein required for cell wall assembly
VAPRSRAARRRLRLATAVGLTAVSALGLGTGFGVQVQRRFDQVPRIVELDGVLTPLDDASVVENYLLVGSDTRDGADPNDADFGSIGDAANTTGRRSDTIMVLRYDRQAGGVSMLSLPRDLWIDIAGDRGNDRINSAYNDGPAALVQTVQQGLGLPIHHYLEVNFQGFKQIVDAIGGVNICFLTAARDTHTGLLIEDPGCHRLDGVQSLQYARSRYYESFVDDDWRIDGTADIGRIGRQQVFVNAALSQAVRSTASNPFAASGVVDASVSSLLVDSQLDLIALADQLRPAASGLLAPYSLPVRPTEHQGKAVLELQPELALPLLAFFQGGAPAPV